MTDLIPSSNNRAEEERGLNPYVLLTELLKMALAGVGYGQNSSQQFVLNGGQLWRITFYLTFFALGFGRSYLKKQQLKNLPSDQIERGGDSDGIIVRPLNKVEKFYVDHEPNVKMIARYLRGGTLSEIVFARLRQGLNQVETSTNDKTLIVVRRAVILASALNAIRKLKKLGLLPHLILFLRGKSGIVKGLGNCSFFIPLEVTSMWPGLLLMFSAMAMGVSARVLVDRLEQLPFMQSVIPRALFENLKIYLASIAALDIVEIVVNAIETQPYEALGRKVDHESIDIDHESIDIDELASESTDSKDSTLDKEAVDKESDARVQRQLLMDNHNAVPSDSRDRLASDSPESKDSAFDLEEFNKDSDEGFQRDLLLANNTAVPSDSLAKVGTLEFGENIKVNALDDTRQRLVSSHLLGKDSESGKSWKHHYGALKGRTKTWSELRAEILRDILPNPEYQFLEGYDLDELGPELFENVQKRLEVEAPEYVGRVTVMLEDKDGKEKERRY